MPPGDKKVIRVQENETTVDIELSERLWNKLIKAFNDARINYGYSGFFPV
jgi:hypothetical protein